MKRRTLVGSLAATAVAAPFVHANAQAPMTLNGAVQFNDDHAFNKALSIEDVYPTPFRELWMRNGRQTFDPLKTL